MRTLAIFDESSLSSFGRHVFGAAALALGLITLAWHEDNGWHQSHYFVYAAYAALILGGIAIQFRRTAKTGAAALARPIFVFALRCLPESSPNRRSTTAGATSSSSSLS